jgi:Fe-S cluster assembly ATPase SufC
MKWLRVNFLRAASDSDRRRSVILVTNALQFLAHPRVDIIVVLSDGRVVEHGTYALPSQANLTLFLRDFSLC